MMALTSAQARYLNEIRAAGPAGRRYNGHARKPLTVLKAAGLIRLEYDQEAHAKGGGIQITEIFVAIAAAV